MEKKLNANHLKLIAIIAMTADHIADLLFPGFPAAPIPVMLHIVADLRHLLCGFSYVKDFSTQKI